MNSDTIDKFEAITKYSLRDYLQEFVDFVNNKQQTLIAYYSGDITSYDETIFLTLDKLRKQDKEIINTIQINNHNFLTTDFWELLEEIESVGTELDTLNKMSKWLRSSIFNAMYSEGFESEEILKEGQLVEDLLSENEFPNYVNDWVQIAIRNDLNEEKYNSSGGTKVSLPLKNSFSDLSYITTVVDNLYGKNIYGKDLDRTLAFEDNDLKILSPTNTIIQAANILINLKRGDVPEFPEDGVDEGLVVGSNLNSVLYPVIFRQLFSLFTKDDTFSSIAIEDINQEEDKVSMTFKVDTKLSEEIIVQL